MTDGPDFGPPYSPAEVAALLGRHVSEPWVRAFSREEPTLVIRHTGRRKMLLTEERVRRLRLLITGPAIPAVTGTASAGVDPMLAGGVTCKRETGAMHVLLAAPDRPALRSLNARPDGGRRTSSSPHLDDDAHA